MLMSSTAKMDQFMEKLMLKQLKRNKEKERKQDFEEKGRKEPSHDAKLVLPESPIKILE